MKLPGRFSSPPGVFLPVYIYKLYKARQEATREHKFDYFYFIKASEK